VAPMSKTESVKVEQVGQAGGHAVEDTGASIRQ